MKLLIFILFLCLSFSLISQNTNEYRVSVYNCYVAPNYSKLPPIKPGYVGEISIGQNLNGEKSWHKYYNYPTFYISVFGGYPGNKEYGYFFSLSPQFLFTKPINDKLNCGIKTGLSIAYHTNTYDVTDNSSNMLIGSHLTAIANIEVGLNYEYIKNNFIGVGLGALHFSNGHCKLPNIGMNLPAVNLYYKYRLDEILILEENEKDIVLNSDWNYFAFIGIGMHEYGSSTKPANGPKYRVYDLGFGISKQTNLIHKFSLGFNLLNYGSFKKFIIDQELNIGDPFLKSSAFTVFGAHEFMFGKFGLYTELGIDIYKPFYRYFVTIYGDKFGAKDILKSINSNKLGLRYRIIDTEKFKSVAGINLKVNLAQADFIEIFYSFEF
ncbi:MAG: acyloxyacyl hydrolase [Bacteroidales bacterium]|nr:acyloxyacyl hydrolase [Bacteroidales bacterium]